MRKCRDFYEGVSVRRWKGVVIKDYRLNWDEKLSYAFVKFDRWKSIKECVSHCSMIVYVPNHR